MVIRSWNVFHGNTVPPSRRGRLREMVELAAGDAPDVLLLQELPVWALPELESWSGMEAFSEIARPPRWPPTLAAWLTRLHNGFFRSRLAGQANAILVARTLSAVRLGGRQVSEPGRERRVVHAVRVEGLGVAATTHLTNALPAPAVQRAELERVRQFVDSLAAVGEPRLIGGDLNHRDPMLPGYDSGDGGGIDHILVAGIAGGPLTVWEPSRRVQNGLVLSDHAPVERRVG